MNAKSVQLIAVLGNILENSITMVCWTALALYFDHWWIALFSILCFSSIKVKSRKVGGER